MSRITKLTSHLKALLFKEITFEDESDQLFIVLRSISLILYLYYIVIFILGVIANNSTYLMMIFPCLLANTFCLLSTYHYRRRIVFHIYSAFMLLWIVFFVVLMGWDCGIQHFMFPLLLISFFATYDNLRGKITYTLSIFLLRLVLYFYTKLHVPIVSLTDFASTALQITNTSAIFVIMFFVCWFYSQTNQKTQAKLSDYNERLKHDAATDALTGLMNRRSMYDLLNTYTDPKSKVAFSVAIGDIDLFKHINDTKGHNCGDKVLHTLSICFQKFMSDKGMVCRWGGEEFLFLLPNFNGDTAFSHIFNLSKEIEELPITYKDEILHVTMTFGVEEYDFNSSITELIKNADEKLYLGKSQGRNKVIY